MPLGNKLFSEAMLTHWGRVMHICVGILAIIGSNNGLSPGRRQAIIWTNAAILLIRPLGTNFSEILIEIHTFSFKKMHLKMSSGKWRPFCLGLNVLNQIYAHFICHAVIFAGVYIPKSYFKFTITISFILSPTFLITTYFNNKFCTRICADEDFHWELSHRKFPCDVSW